MNNPIPALVQILTWQEAERFARMIREQVFIDEQHVPVELEWDGLDNTAYHAVAFAGRKAVGTARLLPDGHIGRMAVLKTNRHQGIGSQLLAAMLQQAQKIGCDSVKLSAQLHAIPFYEQHGFEVLSDSYLDAGILHKDMVYNKA